MRKTLLRKMAAIGLFSLAIISSIGFSFAEWIYTSPAVTAQPASVQVGSSATINISIFNLVSTSSLQFDSDFSDNEGRVTSDASSEEKRTLAVTGTLKGYDQNGFIGIRPVLQIDSAHRSDYETLVAQEYIQEPKFEDLLKDDPAGSSTEGFYWSGSGSSNRNFILNYAYSYGAFFDGVNPSVFFDSNRSNSYKKGKDYSNDEVTAILGDLAKISGARWTLYLDIMTESSTFALTFNAGTGAVFSEHDSSTSSTLDQITYHSKVTPSVPKKTSYEFKGWTYGAQSYLGSFYLNDIVSTSSPKSLSFSAKWSQVSTATLVLQYTVANSSSSINYMISNSSGNTSGTYAYSASSKNVSLNVGDIFIISSLSSVKDITADSGLKRVGFRRYQVTSSGTFNIYIEAIKTFAISFHYQSDDVTNQLPLLKFKAGATTVEYSNGTFTPASVMVVEGTSIDFSNIRGVSSFGGTTKGSLTPTNDISMNIIPSTSIALTVTFTPDNSTNGGSSKYSLFVSNTTGFSQTIGGMESTSSTDESTYYLCSGESYKFTGLTNIQAISPGSLSGDTSSSYNIDDVTAITITGKNGTSCIVGTTEISMADGSVKLAKDIVLGDMVETFDFETGSYSSQPIIFAERQGSISATLISLHFDDGTTTGIINQHSFFDYEKRDLMVIDKDSVVSSVGKRLLTKDGNGFSSKTIVSYDIENTVVDAYEFITAYDLNFFADNMLSCEGTILRHTFFSLDDDLKYDPVEKANDIATYGLYVYDDFKDYMTEFQFDLLNGPYFKVAIGKGYMSYEELFAAISTFTNEEDAV
ncbi:MAG: hypothetical protein LKE31_01480 [Bacilli bacterium]|jgi:uncharacterized repeat protein (TIGR02543 family)|nr:hypothetical protein [Bacilli bacterium]